MTRRRLLSVVTLMSLTAIALGAQRVGEPAPAFSNMATNGKAYALKDYAGKFVVLEWTNPLCPFVHKFYDSGTMQALQKKETAKGVAYKVLARGKGGPKPALTSVVRVNYTGWTTDGRMFDSSVVKGEPAEFSLTAVIVASRVPGAIRSERSGSESATSA